MICFILILSVSCNGAPQRKMRFRKPFYNYVNDEVHEDHYSSADFALGLQTQLNNGGVDFYVLAPQDYCIEDSLKGVNCLAILKENYSYTATSGENYTAVKVLYQSIYVWNEQKYGKQVTDWGQVGGLAMNFKIEITTDVNYEKEIEELVFDYGLENVEDGEFWCDLYNGEDCFATVCWQGYGYATKEVAKKHIETYVNENLMKKSEYLQRNENGEFAPTTCVVEETASPLWHGYYHRVGLYVFSKELYVNGYVPFNERISKEDVAELELESAKYSNVYFYPYEKENVKIREVKSEVVSNFKVVDETFVEPLLSLMYCYYDYNFGGEPGCGSMGNFVVSAYLTSLETETIDKTFLSIDWVESRVANVYYDGFCFATVDFFFSTYGGSKITENTDEFLKEYCEDFIRTSLKLIA